MDRALNWKEGSEGGRSWLKGHNLDGAMNKWGVTEPTQKSFDSASPKLSTTPRPTPERKSPHKAGSS
ncbi:MAG TPA: hypothetical protein VFX81_05200, partial [Burkholderiaceae bacterium]|nr:hypothetical protein [Burkholderiaceae bacterium]